MKYRSRPTECEAEQWRFGQERPESVQERAEQIVAWVKNNGGEARYAHHVERIHVHTINGWAYAAPGHYVVMGAARFHVDHDGPLMSTGCRTIRDFYPCDPETFERRWEPTP